MFASKFFVHAKHVSNFAAAYADVAGRHVAVRTEVAPQFEDESLAETHDFGVALAAWAEVGTAFATAHRQSGESVFECLFKAQEFQN